MSDRVFVELKFSQDTVKIFDKFLKEIIPENMLYYSPVAEHIRGNMSKTLHCTIFFGLNEQAIANVELKKILNENQIKLIELGELSYINGYENLYKVLIINILDRDGKLNSLHNKIEDFALREDTDFKVREFKPHLTLAYVQNEFELPSNLPELPKKVNIVETRISLVSEFNKQVNI
jgi:2'-5' RNA ligase